MIETEEMTFHGWKFTNDGEQTWIESPALVATGSLSQAEDLGSIDAPDWGRVPVPRIVIRAAQRSESSL